MKKELLKTICLIFQTQALRNNNVEIFELAKSNRVKGFREGNPQICVRLYGLYSAN